MESLEKKFAEKNEEIIKRAIKDMSLSFMAKMIDLIHEKFSAQFVPLSEDASVAKNIPRRVEDDQTRLTAELRAINKEQFHIDHTLSEVLAAYDAKKGERSKHQNRKVI